MTTVNPRNLGFYAVQPDIIRDSARKLLREYSHVPEDGIDAHVEAIRQRAFKIWPYPCIGMFRFLDLSISTTAVYPEVLERTKAGEKLLDLGCCFGQEIRQLVFDGVPSENLYGSDLRPEFLDLGFDLFKDRETLKSTLIAADVFATSTPLLSLRSSLSIVYTGAFFHLFSLAEQTTIAKLVVTLLKPEPGVLVIGRQVGNVSPGLFETSGYTGEKERYRHNPDSWREFWNRIGDETGSQWDTDAVFEQKWEGMTGAENDLMDKRREVGARRMRFVVRRVE